MKIFKIVLGWLIILNILPLVFALTTLDGSFCYHGVCEDVIVFWGGYLIGLQLELMGVAIIGVVFYLLN